MGLNDRGVNKDLHPNARRSINFGYITIPVNVDRDKFIQQCLRTEKFSVLVEGGGVMHNCLITKSALKEIYFPVVGGNLGSAVCFFTDIFTSKVVIVGVVSKEDEVDILLENSYLLKRTIGNSYALLSVNGDGQINIDVIGGSSSGKLNINIRNQGSNAEMNVFVGGVINLYAEGSINIKTVGGEINLTSDTNINIESSKEVRVRSSKFMVHNANESMVRGDQLYSSLEKTNSLVNAIKETLLTFIPFPSDGGASLKVKAVQKLGNKATGDITKIKSEKSFLE